VELTSDASTIASRVSYLKLPETHILPVVPILCGDPIFTFNMGIEGFRDLIKEHGELVQIARLGADCREQDRRPYRIAVDESG
jgi:hypothetical protein